MGRPAWAEAREAQSLLCPKCGHAMGLEPTLNPDAFYDSCPECGYMAVVTEGTAPWKSRKGVVSFSAARAARRCVARLRR